MASLPRPASQRRQSPQGADNAGQQHEHTERTSSFSAASEDSQTVLLNPSQSSEPTSQAAQNSSSNTISKTTELTVESSTAEEDAEPRKCWICFNDETEDDETTSEWRSPCPCVLVAHEKCLLDWIADMEAPSSNRRAGGKQGKILCPQCKSEIKLQRPRSLVVDTVRLGEHLASFLLLPGVVLFAGSAAYTTLALIGRAQVYEIFGTEDGLRILAPLYRAPEVYETSAILRLYHSLRDHWRLQLGLPLIPTVLLASRTTLLDSFLPFLPLIFFVSSGRPQDEMLQYSWPPSAAFTISALPYIRGIYNAYYERVWLPREQRWLTEIQPRAGSDPEPNNLDIQLGPLEDNHAHHDHMHGGQEGEEGDVIEEAIELEVDFDLFADWNNGGAVDNHAAPENPPVPIARGPGPPAPPEPIAAPIAADHIPNNNAQDAAPAPNIPQQPPAAVPRRNRVRRERHIAYSTSSLADTILGALIFPSVAAAVGEALKHILPKSWVTAPPPSSSSLAGGGAKQGTGFLQARWGRSILGGLVFVGVKDAVLLYVRWKMAQNHRRRKVLDYGGSKGKGRGREKGAAGSS